MQSKTLSTTGFVIAVDSKGGVWSWGEGRFGQLGLGVWSLYVCMYVFMHACMHVCLFVCMYE